MSNREVTSAAACLSTGSFAADYRGREDASLRSGPLPGQAAGELDPLMVALLNAGGWFRGRASCGSEVSARAAAVSVRDQLIAARFPGATALEVLCVELDDGQFAWVIGHPIGRRWAVPQPSTAGG